MKLVLNRIYNGFKLIEKKNIDEIKSTAWTFAHIKSGAKLLYLQNEDDNKVFSIAFRTPPKDNKGIPHILEHSVLCGSVKFPTKEPFVELIKGSLNTFLNAMTFPDKTMYPVASRNNKDFLNLMNVYLDAVFYPNIYNTPEIFMQEGWHYELDNKNSDIFYKGVVYNEMKGAFSSPETTIRRISQQSLFKDTPYGYISGGDPDEIPKLSYEEFIDFHKTYYHPSNSYIYLYGDLDIIEHLDFIDKEYLNNFSKEIINSNIPLQKPYNKMTELVRPYPISSDESDKNKTFLSLNYVIDNVSNRELCMAFDILTHILLGTPAAPLRKALLKSGICKDVIYNFNNSLLQPTFSIILMNSNEHHKEDFKNIITETLNHLIDKGIDKKLIQASINITEFKLREADFEGLPKGIIYSILSLNSWLYDKNPTTGIEYENTLKKIKKSLETNYFENLIEKYILKNTHCSLVILKPDKALAKKESDKIEKYLNIYKSNLKDRELDILIERTKTLKEMQNTPDSLEALTTIPLLSLDDIKKKIEKLPLVEKVENDIKILFHPQFTSGISYVNLIFDSTAVNQEHIPYIGLLADILGKICTKKYNYSDLSNEINIHTGGINFTTDLFIEINPPFKYHPKFTVSSKALTFRLPELIDLILEIINNTDFSNRKRLKEIVQEIKSQIEMEIMSKGHIITSERLESYISQDGYYNEMIDGLSYYKFISEIENSFTNRADEIIEILETVSNLIFNKNNLIISFTSEEEDYKKFGNAIHLLDRSLNNDKLKHHHYEFKTEKRNEGLLTQSNVQYIAKGYNFRDLGFNWKGSMLVLKLILGTDYLWNRVRVVGGAYGAFTVLKMNGNVNLVSYRDPNLKETFKVYNETGNYIRNFTPTKREMDKFIIGTIGQIDRPLTPSMKGERATEYYLRKITYNDLLKEREEILDTKPEDIRRYAKLFDEIANNNYICVLGNEQVIKRNSNLFDNLVKVFE